MKIVLNLISPNQSLLKTGSGDEESIVDAQLQQRNKNLRATISSQLKALRAENSISKKITESVEGLMERLEAFELLCRIRRCGYFKDSGENENRGCKYPRSIQG